ncbi:MAG: hypothetical protein WBA77_15000 [Microcoleaceae cyanobacterium]
MNFQVDLVLPIICVFSLALVHLYASKLKFLTAIPRARWLSMSSGVSVAYVFVHLLPDLSERQVELSQSSTISFLEHHVYLLALLGLSVFYGLERVVSLSQQTHTDEDHKMGIYWLHIASFTLYNALIGYLLFHREETGLNSLIVYTIAMALHFVVNDSGLNQDHQSIYRQSGRWILAGAIIAGSIVGMATKISEAAVSILFSFLAGAIILNVMKEELPEERQSKFSAFTIGSLFYTMLLLLL